MKPSKIRNMKQKYFIILLLIFSTSSLFAQTHKTNNIEESKVTLIMVEQIPLYEGGNKKMIKGLNNTLELDKSISGSLLVQNWTPAKTAGEKINYEYNIEIRIQKGKVRKN